MSGTDTLRETNADWLQRWKEQNIGWHHVEFNQHLLNHWHSLRMPRGSLVLAPLCGKSRDMLWLAKQGYRIRGIELSPLAVESFFREQSLHPEVTRVAEFDRWRAGPYELYCGDIFDLAQLEISDTDSVYDRASLIALNPRQRAHYAEMLCGLLPKPCRMLLVAMDYPQEEMSGPPYSVREAEVRSLFEPRFQVRLLHTLDLQKESKRYDDKEVSRMLEQVYLLNPR
ncbi:MAG: thiopurine S-methyltransferase [Candidatus Thiodiazotropha sp.]